MSIETYLLLKVIWNCIPWAILLGVSMWILWSSRK